MSFPSSHRHLHPPPTEGAKEKEKRPRACVPGSGEPLCVDGRFIQAVMTSPPENTLEGSTFQKTGFTEWASEMIDLNTNRGFSVYLPLGDRGEERKVKTEK